MEEERGYVTKESREGAKREYRFLSLQKGKITSQTKSEITGTTKNCLYPSDLGMVVSDFLSEHFVKIMDYSFTANVEDELDKIATDGLDWKKMLKNFMAHFMIVLKILWRMLKGQKVKEYSEKIRNPDIV